jgi:3-hydroxy-9,10-secoandrosta-1,3,5(10)-triene-9,17-dione monooxygenase
MTSAPAPEELVRRARALSPMLAQRAAIGDRERRLPKETIADMQAAGLFRVLQPKRWGGYEMSPNVFFDVQLALAEGDMSPAWVYGVVGLHPWLVAVLDDRAAQDIWGKDSSTLIGSSLHPSGTAKEVDGGYRLSGRWKFSSGCDHCDWSVLGAMTPAKGDGPPDWRLFLVPRKDYRIVDTWNVPGLKGTGSNDVVVEDAFVPAYLTQTQLDNFLCRGPGQAVNTAALYRMPFGQIFFRGISTGAVGALQGMLNAFVDYGSKRVSVGGGSTAQDPVVQLVCAEVATALDEITLVLHRNFRNLMAYAEKGEAPPLVERLQYRFQSAVAVERCSLLAARLFKAAGGAGLFAELPFARFFADISAGRQHVGNQFESIGRNWGAALLGGEPKRDLVL